MQCWRALLDTRSVFSDEPTAEIRQKQLQPWIVDHEDRFAVGRQRVVNPPGRRAPQVVQPPSTIDTVPVVKADSSDPR